MVQDYWKFLSISVPMFGTRSSELNKIYGVLESYIMRRLVVHATTKNYNNLFTSLILNGVLDAQTLKERLNKGSDARMIRCLPILKKPHKIYTVFASLLQLAGGVDTTLVSVSHYLEQHS